MKNLLILLLICLALSSNAYSQSTITVCSSGCNYTFNTDGENAINEAPSGTNVVITGGSNVAFFDFNIPQGKTLNLTSNGLEAYNLRLDVSGNGKLNINNFRGRSVSIDSSYDTAINIANSSFENSSLRYLFSQASLEQENIGRLSVKNSSFNNVDKDAVDLRVNIASVAIEGSNFDCSFPFSAFTPPPSCISIFYGTYTDVLVSNNVINSESSLNLVNHDFQFLNSYGKQAEILGNTFQVKFHRQLMDAVFARDTNINFSGNTVLGDLANIESLGVRLSNTINFISGNNFNGIGYPIFEEENSPQTLNVNNNTIDNAVVGITSRGYSTSDHVIDNDILNCSSVGVQVLEDRSSLDPITEFGNLFTNTFSGNTSDISIFGIEKKKEVKCYLDLKKCKKKIKKQKKKCKKKSNKKSKKRCLKKVIKLK